MPERARLLHSAGWLAAEFHARRVAGLLLRGMRRLASGAPVEAAATPPCPIATASPATTRPRALVIDSHAPRADIDSGSVRMVALLRLLNELGLTAAFVPDDFRHVPLAAAILPPDIFGVGDAIRWMDRHAQDIRLVVLSRHTTAGHWLPLVRARLPHVPVVFDTVDLHFVREQRHGERVASRLLGALARVTRRRELALVNKVDRTWVVSGSERQLLSALCPGAVVDCISNIVDPLPATPPMEERTDFVFVGNFRHEPNVDAARWLETLWPALQRRCPQARLRIIGPYLPSALATRLRALPSVVVMGHVGHLEEELLRARVMLAPLRYGAGVKGKINAAFACGLPVVGTYCAVEGMQFGPSPVALVADEDERIVELAARLYAEPALWASLRDAARTCLDEHFSTHAARAALVASLRGLGVLEPGT